ncbi:MAG TPA: cysteine--tRNA ligase, partial [Devosiaceae bacterium]|nr:cysteine--tRNA ligase [Devosiaceae bacterium]
FKASARLLGLMQQSPEEWMGARQADAAVDTGELANRIGVRLSYLAENNFADADKIRDELAAAGIQLMDYKDPETGERRTKWEVRR